MKMRGLCLAGMAMLAAACARSALAPPDLDNLDDPGRGAHLIRGDFKPGDLPDGNTIILEVQGGLIVVDTGRHPRHAEKILAFASASSEPILAIFNSHWHLDHISGNIALHAAFPRAKVYSNDPALSQALSSFLARGADHNRQVLADPKADPVEREDARIDLATVEAGARLHPDVSIETTQTLIIGGRRLEVHLAAGASAGDVWLYDPRARLVIAGDLITLPAPFLDTACPSRWSTALEEVLGQPFAHVAPGHGRLMVRADVVRYREAFNALLACAKGTGPAATCARAWASAAAPLQDDPTRDLAGAIEYATYYVEEILRKPTKRPDCTG
jgi:glyoxylase-like metal-dependent hydrolase (beta-lactamase superfamily II)